MATVTQPTTYAVALTQASLAVLTANPTRQGLKFHNPNTGKNIWIAPAPFTAAPNGAGSLQIFPGGDRDFSVANGQAANGAWNACTDTGQNANLTILEWTANAQ